MAQISPSEDIRSVTDLKRNTRDILDHLHTTGRPVILTVNGRADSVLLDVRVYEKHLQAGNLAKLLAPAERDVESGRTRPARYFLKEFKRAKKIKG
jgi:prevent-host-death family protein